MAAQVADIASLQAEKLREAEQAAGSSPVVPSDRLAIIGQRFISISEFQLQWNSAADRVCEVQFSTNLTRWDVLTNIAATSSNSIGIDPNASTAQNRFYHDRII